MQRDDGQTDGWLEVWQTRWSTGGQLAKCSGMGAASTGES